jgi:multisubunit Na+/H+ antiporter MnhC subunit
LRAINPVFFAVAAVVIVAFLLFLIYRLVIVRRRQPSTPREEVPITVLPKTSLGRWSLGLAIASIVVFVVAAGPLREQWGLNENEELVNPVLTVVLTIIIVGTSAADLVTGLISVIKSKERSVLVFSGMLITFWWGIIGAVGYWII